jgi:predicted glycosyltransferase involved in capsule biosynthesis
MLNKLLTVIIPLRLSVQIYEGIKRLKHILDTIPTDLIDVLIIDYGSPTEERTELKFVNSYSNVTLYCHQEAENIAFSIGHARDLGAQLATTPTILFHDIDFICSPTMYRKIQIEIINRNIASNQTNDFFCVPVAFLNDAGNEQYYSHLAEDKDETEVDNYLQNIIITDSQSYCQSLVYGSSAIVVNRYHYLTLGGHHRDFSGHGAEDYDILHRLSYYNPKAPRTSDYYHNLSDSPLYHYQGFRTYFALHGMDIFMKGIFMLHLYHPPRRIRHYHQSQKNFPLLKQVMIKFDVNKQQPHPLRDHANPNKTLILSKQTTSFVDTLRYALPAMGEVQFMDERLFADASTLIKAIKNKGITRVGFKNPYGNPHRLALYQGVKQQKLPYWVFDRGALPDSWFFDSNGFNADSHSYHRKHWDMPLNEHQQSNVRHYIDNLCKSDQTLEKNGKRKTEQVLREKLKLGDKKVLFIPFQRPSDSVCQYFSASMQSAEGFNDLVSKMTQALDTNQWVVIGKKHPLESGLPNVTGVTFVNNAHIHDLLTLADCVVVLNSGVGLLAGLFNTPTIYCGQAFYGHKGINYSAHNITDVLSLLATDLQVNKTQVERFTYHLIERVYSFGTSSYSQITRKEDGAKLSLVNDILFETICGLSKKPIIIGKKIASLDLKEPLFFSFGGHKTIKGVNHSSPDILASFHYRQRLTIKLFSFISQPVLSENQRVKLKKDPERFFRDANNIFSRFFAKRLNF